MPLLARSSPKAWGQSERAASGVLGTGGGGGNREWGAPGRGQGGLPGKNLKRASAGVGVVRGRRGCGCGRARRRR